MTSNQPKKADPATDRRKKTRYKISPSFRLNAVLALCGQATESSSGAWKDWPGTLIDLSGGGANVQVNLAAVAFPDNPCRLKLSRGNYKLEVPGTVAHFVCDSRYATCGVNFDFSYAGVEKAYHRMLEPTIIGASLAPVEAATDSSGTHQEQYTGKNSAELTIRRERPGGEVGGFEFRTNRYTVEAARAAGDDAGVRPALKFQGGTSEDSGTGESPGTLSTVQEADLRWQFGLTVSNLSTAVAADVRKFLLSLA